METKLALCALVKDIEKARFGTRTGEIGWAETIKQYRPYLSQAIFAVSDQTTDATTELLTKATDTWDLQVQIMPYQWQGDFSHALNAMLDQSNAEWNLRLHGDRMIAPNHLTLLPGLLNGKHNIKFIRLPEKDRLTYKTRAYFPAFTRKGIRYDGIIWETPIKKPKVATGRIADHCVLPDEEYFGSMEIRHDATGDEEHAPIWKALTEQEVLRIRKAQRNAETAADFYTVGQRIFTMAASKRFFNPQHAERMFRKAQELEPDSYAPLVMLGDCARFRGQGKRAIALYERAKVLGSKAANERLTRVRDGDRQDFQGF